MATNRERQEYEAGREDQAVADQTRINGLRGRLNDVRRNSGCMTALLAGALIIGGYFIDRAIGDPLGNAYNKAIDNSRNQSVANAIPLSTVDARIDQAVQTALAKANPSVYLAQTPTPVVNQDVNLTAIVATARADGAASSVVDSVHATDTAIARSSNMTTIPGPRATETPRPVAATPVDIKPTVAATSAGIQFDRAPDGTVIIPDICATQPSRDGESIMTIAAPEGQVNPRLPISRAERADIVDLSWAGKGFSGYDRAIIVTRRTAQFWELDAKSGSRTARVLAFCGKTLDYKDGGEIERWAIGSGVNALQQASRDPQGKQPTTEEIGVFEVDYEKGEVITLKTGNLSAAQIAERLDLSYRDDKGVVSNQPLKAAEGVR